jgi:hypothetical protein
MPIIPNGEQTQIGIPVTHFQEWNATEKEVWETETQLVVDYYVQNPDKLIKAAQCLLPDQLETFAVLICCQSEYYSARVMAQLIHPDRLP